MTKSAVGELDDTPDEAFYPNINYYQEMDFDVFFSYVAIFGWSMSVGTSISCTGNTLRSTLSVTVLLYYNQYYCCFLNTSLIYYSVHQNRFEQTVTT